MEKYIYHNDNVTKVSDDFFKEISKMKETMSLYVNNGEYQKAADIQNEIRAKFYLEYPEATNEANVILIR